MMDRAQGAGLAAPLEDFTAVLKRHGLADSSAVFAGATSTLPPQTHATTILAFKFAGGVMVAGDRRATAGNVVVYERADKVIEIDRHSLMAIAGVPAAAWEMARVLEHSFQFFRRSQLQEMSLDGKARALSKLLRDNLGLVLQGVGLVAPIFAAYDVVAKEPRVYFYDALGAQFEVAEFTATGSGSPAVRSVLHFQNTWGKKPLHKLKEPDALLLALRALETAAEADTATGGVDRRRGVYPIVKIISESGISTIPEKMLASLYRREILG